MIGAFAVFLLSGAAPAAMGATALEQRGIDAIHVWNNCLRRAADDFTASREPADTVVDAIIGACGTEEAAVRSAWYPAYAQVDVRNAEADTDAALVRMRRQSRGQLLARVLRSRLPVSPNP